MPGRRESRSRERSAIVETRRWSTTTYLAIHSAYMRTSFPPHNVVLTGSCTSKLAQRGTTSYAASSQRRTITQGRLSRNTCRSDFLPSPGVAMDGGIFASPLLTRSVEEVIAGSPLLRISCLPRRARVDSMEQRARREDHAHHTSLSGAVLFDRLEILR